MRKQILTITLMLGSLFPTSLHAQHAYRPFVVDGKDWVSDYGRETDIIYMEDGKIVGDDRTEDYGEMHEVLKGDTVINELTYKKVQTTTPYKILLLWFTRGGQKGLCLCLQCSTGILAV